MALTPEEIHSKTFRETSLKKGYDQIEVDDFLDAIELTVAEMAREIEDLRSATRGEIPSSVTAKLDELTAENEGLSSSLNQAHAEIESLRAQHSDLAAASTQGDSAVVDQLNQQIANTQNELSSAQQELAAAQQAITSAHQENEALNARVAELSAHNSELAQNTAVVPISSSDASLSAVRMLELAQRTADETVAGARIEGEQILHEASSEAERLLTDTKSDVANITREFEGQKAQLERKVEELRAYEREYRGRLRSYLEGQLRELEAKKLDVELEAGTSEDQ
jgi:DivIVA domain-containing protein